MSPHRIGARVALLGVLAVGIPSAPGLSRARDLEALIAQLDGRGCRYSDDVFAPCTETAKPYGWFWWLDPTGKYRCTLGAARCLGHMGPAAARAVPALTRALAAGPNDYDSGDGTIAARSAVATALAEIGDPRAIVPLAEALARAVPADRGAGALRSNEPAARIAIIEALGRFGPAAGRHWAPVAVVLRGRNADTEFLASRREQYERMAGLDRAVAERRRQQPGMTTFEVSEASIGRARCGGRSARAARGRAQRASARARCSMTRSGAARPSASPHSGRARPAPCPRSSPASGSRSEHSARLAAA